MMGKATTVGVACLENHTARDLVRSLVLVGQVLCIMPTLRVTAWGCCIGKYAMTAEESMGKEDYDRLLMPAMGTARRTGSLCAMYFYFTRVNQLNQRNKQRKRESNR